jgi:hypothetical protein
MTAAHLPQLPIPAQRRESGRVAMGKTNKRAVATSGSDSSQVPSQKEAGTDRSADRSSERSTDRKSTKYVIAYLENRCRQFSKKCFRKIVLFRSEAGRVFDGFLQTATYTPRDS